MRAARIDCESRPAVDWQAECRRLVSERRDAASRPAPVEVRGVVEECGECDGVPVMALSYASQNALEAALTKHCKHGQRVTVTVTPEG